MAEQEPNSREDFRREALRYLPLSQDTQAQRQIRGARVVGGIISCLAAVFGVPVFILSSLNFSGTATRSEWSSLICPGIIAGFLILLTLYEHFYVKRRGFLQGILIGLGIALLLEGACFSFLR